MKNGLLNHATTRISCIAIISGSIFGGVNAVGQNWRKCETDNNRPPLECLQKSLSWADTAHCQNRPTASYVCAEFTGTIVRHNLTITWTGAYVYVGGHWQMDDTSGNVWVWNNPPAGCASYVGISPNNPSQQIWTVYTSTEVDNPTNVQGATCGEVDLG
jgi:hypothetical protein